MQNTDATTPLAQIIPANAHLHMRGSEVHVLIDALLGEPIPQRARVELVQTLASLVHDNATGLIDYLTERAEAV